MNVLLQQLESALMQAFQTGLDATVTAEQLTLSPTRKEFDGDYTLVLFPWVKALGKSPDVLAQAIGDALVAEGSLVERYNVIKGFLNLVVKDAVIAKLYQDVIAPNQDWGRGAPKAEKVMVEFSSPNTNKPLHLGHLRNNFLGNAMSNILAANGYEVVRTNLVNDRGIHICKSMLAYMRDGQGETPESRGIAGDKLVGDYYVRFEEMLQEEIRDWVESKKYSKEEAKKHAPIMHEAQELLRKWEAGDEEVLSLWRKMNGWVLAGHDATYKRIGSNFDKFYFESNTYLLGKEIVEDGLASGVFFQKEDGSVWIDLSDEGLDQKIVRRSDGTSVYITQDMGTADLKFQDFGCAKSLYVVGDEQDYHFQVLFKTLKRLGRPYADGMYHLSYGMVELPDGKMKSRDGNVVDAEDLIDKVKEIAREKTYDLGKVQGLSETDLDALFEMIGLGAIKYFLLKVGAKKRMMYNPQESVDLTGNTATAIQYSHARIASLLRKAETMGVQPDAMALAEGVSLQVQERALILALNNLPDVVAEAAETYSTDKLAEYCYDLSRDFNRLFQELPILKGESVSPAEQAFRLSLAKKVGQTLKLGFGLLGIDVPDRM